MATIETPPNSTPVPPPPRAPEQPEQRPEQPQPLKVQAGRHGELHHDELIHLLDSYDDERAKGRFRESIYISIIVYLALAWLAIWGPRVLFHQGKIITAQDHEKIARLDMPKLAPKVPKIVPRNPVIDQKTMDKIKAMQPAPAPQPAPQPPAPTPPQPTPPAAAPPTPPPPAPTPQVQPRLPQQPQPSAIPEAPKPNFNVNQNAGDNIRNAARNAGAGLRGTGIRGENHAVGQQAANSGIQLLTDTNVDFDPYLKRLLTMIKASWYPLIPEECYPPLSKEGTTLIRFSINKDGTLTANGMHLEDSTHDVAIDKAAWGSITSIGQFPPLPSEFNGPKIELRIEFIISRNPQPDR